MRIKKVKIGIQSVEDTLNDAKAAMKNIERGETIQKSTGVYFTSLEAFRKVLTPKRLELLRVIKNKAPESLRELAEFAGRDVKNVSDDVKYLEQVGLIERRGTGRATKPTFDYDTIALEIAI
ncbi:MAG: Helix-turn-helix domain protein [Syntrophorhabdaceae bacterium PtaU1.Bin034]|jgi:predicted transcriptional regulator|nr:MAG: Helix-turn-helix domain protein [Syntrophorhabdaceae bacterium PtaU1.Bin034]